MFRSPGPLFAFNTRTAPLSLISSLSPLLSPQLFTKFAEVHAVCNAPEVTQHRMKRHPNLTAAGLAKQEKSCEVFSDVYDFGLQLMMIALIAHVAFVAFSYNREMVRLRAAGGESGAAVPSKSGGGGDTGAVDLREVAVGVAVMPSSSAPGST